MEVEAVNGRAYSRLAATQKKNDDTNSSTVVPEQLIFLLIIGLSIQLCTVSIQCMYIIYILYTMMQDMSTYTYL